MPVIATLARVADAISRRQASAEAEEFVDPSDLALGVDAAECRGDRAPAHLDPFAVDQEALEFGVEARDHLRRVGPSFHGANRSASTDAPRPHAARSRSMAESRATPLARDPTGLTTGPGVATSVPGAGSWG